MATSQLVASAVTLYDGCGMCQTMWVYICPDCHDRFCAPHGRVHAANARGFREAIRDRLAIDEERALRNPRGWAT